MISSASIRSRLYNIAQKENIAFQVIVVRYFHERFLYRLSVSEHGRHFYLKGGNFIYALQGLLTRPTVDIDLLGHNIPNDLREITEVFKNILVIDCDDAVHFDQQQIKEQTITENSEYSGIRLTFPASFDTIQQHIQIDIGFGDQITPNPLKISFPVLLNDVPTPELLAYNVETVIAEKFQTMIFLGTLNSRMKDFYDVYKLITSQPTNEDNLRRAIQTTFKNRKTSFSPSHSIFSESFRNDPGRIKMWNAFLKKIRSKEEISLPEVMETIEQRLKTKL